METKLLVYIPNFDLKAMHHEEIMNSFRYKIICTYQVPGNIIFHFPS